MPYWSSETLKRRVPDEDLVRPYDEEAVTHCAYELAMGPEAFITSTKERTKTKLKTGESIVIPSGQFALLLTEEKVKIPLGAIGFISMRFSIKRRGLINVSGFHVDPGFQGRLKFAVYNAGSSDITVSRGDRIFVLWIANLDRKTADGYGPEKDEQNVISSDDQNVMHGEVASPAELKKKLEEVQGSVRNLFWALSVAISIAGAILVRYLFVSAQVPQGDLQKIREDVTKDVMENINRNYQVQDEAGKAEKNPTEIE